MRPFADVGVQDVLGLTLTVKLDHIILFELQRASKKLKLRKTIGVDEVPGEYW